MFPTVQPDQLGPLWWILVCVHGFTLDLHVSLDGTWCSWNAHRKQVPHSNLRDCNPDSALATNPSGAVLLGIKVHVVPIIHTPLLALPITCPRLAYSERSFGELASNCSDSPLTASVVKIDKPLLIIVSIIDPINISVNGGPSEQN
jgi:hypothetical protein